MHFGSGGKNIITNFPKVNCNREVRGLLVQCAHAISRSKDKSLWVENILKRKPKKVAIIAIANRLARQLWAMASKGKNWKDMGYLGICKKLRRKFN